MVETPLISVIITAYNVEKYIRQCIESLLAQTFTSIEFILVDDGSTDRSGEIGDQYAQQYERIQVIHRPNGGPSAARNAGLAIARGKYIGYVDGDDWIEPEMYQKMYDACEQNGAQMAICSYRQWGEGAEKMNPTGNVLVLSKMEAMELYIMGDKQYHIYNSVWSKLFLRSLIDNLRFQEGHKSEDIMYTTCTLGRVETCVFVDELLYNYRIDRTDSIMNSKLEERRFEDEIPFIREQIAYLKGLGMVDLSEKASYQFYRRLLYYYLDFRKRKMNRAARKIIHFLREEKYKIVQIYRKEYVPMGDRVRMQIALHIPVIYYLLSTLYSRFIIPLKQ